MDEPNNTPDADENIEPSNIPDEHSNEFEEPPIPDTVQSSEMPGDNDTGEIDSDLKDIQVTGKMPENMMEDGDDDDDDGDLFEGLNERTRNKIQ